MPRYLNNCKNRNHSKIYGPDAFYDLDTSGPQAQKQFIFRPGDWCIVASEPTPGVIRFAWYKFTSSRLAADEKQQQVRVLCGAFEKEELVPRAEAPSNKYYAAFFNKKGDFKQVSVI